MIKQTLPLGRRIYRIILSVSIISTGVLLMLGCAYIFFSGKGYSRDIVAKIFSIIKIPIYQCIELIIGDIVWELISPSTKKQKINKKVEYSNPKAKIENNHFAIKFTLLGIAVTACVVGFLLGGYADVLTKAINICTECIGLG